MKITVIGGGSTYTPELINGFLARTAQLPASELWLMDIDKERLDVVGGFAQHIQPAIHNHIARPPQRPQQPGGHGR